MACDEERRTQNHCSVLITHRPSQARRLIAFLTIKRIVYSLYFALCALYFSETSNYSLFGIVLNEVKMEPYVL